MMNVMGGRDEPKDAGSRDLSGQTKQGKERRARVREWTFLQKELPNVARSVGRKVKNSSWPSETDVGKSFKKWI